MFWEFHSEINFEISEPQMPVNQAISSRKEEVKFYEKRITYRIQNVYGHN